MESVFNLSNIMKPTHKKNLKFIDRDNSRLITISQIKTIFNNYDHSKLNRYEQSLVWHDVGCLLFGIYIHNKYNVNICGGLTKEEIHKYDSKDKDILEWLEFIDYSMYPINPKHLLYYDNHKFCYENSLLLSSEKFQIIIVSHIFPKGSGHIGCIFILNNHAFYFDPNGLKDLDDPDYYIKFELNLVKELEQKGITYVPYRWKKGIQEIQTNEENKYGIEMIGMCCAWTFLMIELKLMNPHLTIEEIETKLKKKYKYKLTRMIVSYQQEMHNILWKLANEFYKEKLE